MNKKIQYIFYLNQPDYFEVNNTCKKFNKEKYGSALKDGFPSQEVQTLLSEIGFSKVISENDLVPFKSEEIDVFLSHEITGFRLQSDNEIYYMLISIDGDKGQSPFYLISL